MTDSAKITQASENIWKDTLLDAAVVSWVLSPENADNPRKLIHDMLTNEYRIALDPTASVEAKALHDRIALLEEQVYDERRERAELSKRDWTASLCDYLNRIVYENTSDFACACKDGPTAVDLIYTLQGLFNHRKLKLAGAMQVVDRLEAELTEAKRVVEGLVEWAEHRRECDMRTFDSYDPAKGHYRFCNGQYEYRRPLRCTCGLDAVLARAAEWLKGATT